MKLELDFHTTPQLWIARDADTADGAEDSGPLASIYGQGTTREAALIDLTEKLDDYWRSEMDKESSRLSEDSRKWIPVSERRPGEFVRVLAINSAGYMTTTNGIYQYGNGEWAGEDCTAEETHCAISDITHWMPLPEAPK